MNAEELARRIGERLRALRRPESEKPAPPEGWAEFEAEVFGKQWPKDLLAMGVPERQVEFLKGRGLGHFAGYPSFKRLREYMDTKEAGFACLFGRNGTGKTTLASAALTVPRVMRKDCMELFRGEFKWYSGLDVEGCCFIRSTEFFRLSQVDDKRRLEKLLECPLLVFDDLGKEQQTEEGKHQFARLFEMFDRRYGGRLKTIITTNLQSPEEFTDRYDASIMRRLLENLVMIKMDRPVSLHLVKPDIRREGQ